MLHKQEEPWDLDKLKSQINIRKKLKAESKLVAKESLAVLSEFEKLDDEV